VAGLHTTWGNPAFEDYVADRDATVVRRLKQAGAIIVGKSNVPFMLGDYGQTANELFGVTNNPWDATRTPGGSSGGGAAAVAAGMSFLEYGSDLVGSIRIPASFCGVYGLRPSVGIVPLTGLQPPGPPAPPSEMMYMSAVGPLGRSVSDLRLALAVTAGPEAPAVNAYSWSLSRPRHTRLEDFRVGVVIDHERAPVSSEVAAVLADAVDALARAGATVVEGWPAGVDPIREYESFGFHLQLVFTFQQDGHSSATLSEFVDQKPGACRRARLGAAASRTSTCSSAPRTSPPPFPTTADPSTSARSTPGRRKAIRHPTLLDLARVTARLARRGRTRRQHARRSSRWRADRRSALRGRHGAHRRRAAGRSDRGVRAPAARMTRPGANTGRPARYRSRRQAGVSPGAAVASANRPTRQRATHCVRRRSCSRRRAALRTLVLAHRPQRARGDVRCRFRICLDAIASSSDRELSRGDVVPMHRMPRVRRGGTPACRPERAPGRNCRGRSHPWDNERGVP
jgi:Amidase